MTNTKLLIILLRVIGISGLLALVAVFVPMAWMAGIHGWLGLGEMPITPIVEYLARSVAAFYALTGALLLVLAGDIQRYRPAIRFVGLLVALFGVILGGIDISAQMPGWWFFTEGLATIGMGLSIVYLAR